MQESAVTPKIVMMYDEVRPILQDSTVDAYIYIFIGFMGLSSHFMKYKFA